MDGRALVAFAGVLAVHPAVDVDGDEAGLVEFHEHLAVLDRAVGGLALRVHGGGSDRVAVGAGNLDFDGAGGFEVHVGVGPAGEVVEVGVGLLVDGLAGGFPREGAAPFAAVLRRADPDRVVLRCGEARDWRVDHQILGGKHHRLRHPEQRDDYREEGFQGGWSC